MGVSLKIDCKVTSRTSASRRPSDILGFDSPVVDPIVNEFVLGEGRVMCDLDLETNYVVRAVVFAFLLRKSGNRDPAKIGSEVNQTRNSFKSQCELDSE